MNLLTPEIIDALGTLAGALFTALIAYLVPTLKRHFDSVAARHAIDELGTAATVGYHAMQQSVVDEMKEAAKDGKLTREEAAMVLRMARDEAKQQLGANGLERVKSALGVDDIDELLQQRLEAIVSERKPMDKMRRGRGAT